MSEPAASPLARFLAAVEKLPPVAAVTFRGVPQGVPVPAAPVVTRSVTATSRDPRVASESRQHRGLLAIATRTGRDISQLSANPGEREVVLLPGTTLAPVGEVTIPDAGVDVLLLEEIATPDAREIAEQQALPPSREALVEVVTQAVRTAWAYGDVPVTAPGKFAGPLQ